ncbi:hypothetical protein FNS29_00270, partial [Xylella fastidiosa subsp. fastidiosa]
MKGNNPLGNISPSPHDTRNRRQGQGDTEMTLNVSEQAQPQARPPVSETKKEIAAAWAVCEAARKEVRDALYDCEDAA